jgi:hypothetical protein
MRKATASPVMAPRMSLDEVTCFKGFLSTSCNYLDCRLPLVASSNSLVQKLTEPAGQRLFDNRMLNVVLVLVLVTSVLGPVLTNHFAPRLVRGDAQAETKVR